MCLWWGWGGGGGGVVVVVWGGVGGGVVVVVVVGVGSGGFEVIEAGRQPSRSAVQVTELPLRRGAAPIPLFILHGHEQDAEGGNTTAVQQWGVPTLAHLAWYTLASLPVDTQPLISENTPRLSILNSTMRVRGSRTCSTAEAEGGRAGPGRERGMMCERGCGRVCGHVGWGRGRLAAYLRGACVGSGKPPSG